MRRYAAGERNFLGAQLDGADLYGAHLTGANLYGASFINANLEQSWLGGGTFIGANFRGATLRGSQLVGVEFDGANFALAGLDDANLKRAQLGGANMHGAVLRGANLSNSVLRNAQLTWTNFDNAQLQNAQFDGANVECATFRDANLRGASFGRAVLAGASFSGAQIGLNNFSGVDLSSLCDARRAVLHVGPSTVDYESILLSIRSPRLKEFLELAGMPSLFVERMVECAMAMATHGFTAIRSTFISYGQPDEPFARRLHEHLHRSGVTTFFFPEHAVPGEKLHHTLRKGIREHDRLILICSRGSLDRKGVLVELEEALAREHRDGTDHLIPIRLDDYVLKDWAPKNPDVAQAVRDKVVADFEGADQDEDKFQAGILRLLAALRK
jgi:uncharacterized protein YjbI with pentapeptide repeats